MTRRLMADGNTGKVAIMREGSRDTFENPKENLSKIHFHSDLDYMGIVQQILVANVAFPKITGKINSYTSSSKGGGFLGKGTSTKTYYYPALQSGKNLYVIGSIVGDIDGPMLAFRDDVVPLTMIPIFQSNYIKDGSNYTGWRQVSIGLDGNNIVVQEDWYSLGVDIPEQSINNIKIVKFNMMTGANLPATQTLLISPTLFIASRGKLDSRNRYIQRSATGPYWVYYGRTMNSENGGGRWVYPIINNGVVTNAYMEENGYASDTPFYAPPPTGIAV